MNDEAKKRVARQGEICAREDIQIEKDHQDILLQLQTNEVLTKSTRNQELTWKMLLKAARAIFLTQILFYKNFSAPQA